MGSKQIKEKKETINKNTIEYDSPTWFSDDIVTDSLEVTNDNSNNNSPTIQIGDIPAK